MKHYNYALKLITLAPAVITTVRGNYTEYTDQPLSFYRVSVGGIKMENYIALMVLPLYRKQVYLAVLFPEYLEEIDRELANCPRKSVVCTGYPRVENGCHADCDRFLRENGFSCDGCPF